jgi:hypothetical protein
MAAEDAAGLVEALAWSRWRGKAAFWLVGGAECRERATRPTAKVAKREKDIFN